MKLSVSDLWPKIRVENANAIAGLLNPNRTTSRVHVDAYLMDFQAVMTILRSRPTIRCLQRSGTVIDSRALQLNDGETQRNGESDKDQWRTELTVSL